MKPIFKCEMARMRQEDIERLEADGWLVVDIHRYEEPPTLYPGTLRDLFAAAALQGLLSGRYSEDCRANLKEVPEEAFKIADAMIEAREKKQ